MLVWQRHDPLNTLLTDQPRPAQIILPGLVTTRMHTKRTLPLPLLYLRMHVVGRVLVFLALVTLTEPVVTCFFEKRLDPVIPRAVPTLVVTFAGIGMARYTSV